MIWFYSQNQKRSSDFFRNVMSCRIELCEKARKNDNKNGIWNGHALSSSYAILFFRDIYWISLPIRKECCHHFFFRYLFHSIKIQFKKWRISLKFLFSHENKTQVCHWKKNSFHTEPSWIGDFSTCYVWKQIVSTFLTDGISLICIIPSSS